MPCGSLPGKREFQFNRRLQEVRAISVVPLNLWPSSSSPDTVIAQSLPGLSSGRVPMASKRLNRTSHAGRTKRSVSAFSSKPGASSFALVGGHAPLCPPYESCTGNYEKLPATQILDFLLCHQSLGKNKNWQGPYRPVFVAGGNWDRLQKC